MQGQKHLGLQIVVEEIRSKVHPATAPQSPVHRAKGFHCEKAALAMPALRPGIGEINVKSINGTGRKIVEERFGRDVQDLHVPQPPLLRLLSGPAATLGLDVDADEQRVGPARGVRGKEVAIPAADLHFAAAPTGVAREEILEGSHRCRGSTRLR